LSPFRTRKARNALGEPQQDSLRHWNNPLTTSPFRTGASAASFRKARNALGEPPADSLRQGGGWNNPLTTSASRVGLLLLAACGVSDVVAVLPDDDGGAGVDAARADAAVVCGGPAVLVGDGRLRCGGRVAETTFRHAICTCEGLVSAHSVTTDAFDSRTGVSGGGSVGANGPVDVSGPLTVGGSLRVASTGGVDLGAGAPLEVAGSLGSGGHLVGNTSVDVGRDAALAGDVRVERIAVGGVLTQPSGTSFDVDVDEAPRKASAEVQVTLPCDCDEDALLDVAALAAAHRDANDNSSLGLDPAAFADVSGARELVLECGRYYLDRVGGTGSLRIVVRERAALFVDGDLSLTRLEVDLEDGAELDLFVTGNVVGMARWMLGDTDTPSRVRLYVGGAGSVQLTGGGLFAGNVYAPRAELVTPAEVEVFGSLFVRRLAASGPIRVHYDRAVLAAGDDCGELPPECESCLDCRNQACVDGACGPCASDGECCAPLVCAGGVCVPEPF